MTTHAEIEMKKFTFPDRKDNLPASSAGQRKISSYFFSQTRDNTPTGAKVIPGSSCETANLPINESKKRKTSDQFESPQCKLSKQDIKFNIMGSNSLKTDASVQHSMLDCILIDDDFERITLTRPLNAVSENKENITRNTNKVSKLNSDSEDDKINEELDGLFFEDFSYEAQRPLNSYERCKVTNLKREENKLIVSVRSEENISIKENIICRGFWKDMEIQEGDIVNIDAVKENGSWVIDNTHGILVMNPDVLISGTTVASATFCPRKAVLAERFKKIESLPFEKQDATPLLIGCLAHSIMQKAVVENYTEINDIKKYMDIMLRTKSTISRLYQYDISIDTCRNYLLPYVQSVHKFMQHYIHGRPQAEISNVPNNYKGSIVEITDIEETIWVPKVGLKGKIDITAEVEMRSQRKRLPIEVKTGRPTFSLEHKGQLMLYIMMMTLTGQDIDTGLLLYLRDNLVQEMRSTYSEQRDLILLRNSISGNLKFMSTEDLVKIKSKSDLPVMKLPSPINHPGCHKCSMKAICTAYLSKDNENRSALSPDHHLTKISDQIFQKVKPAHIDYVFQWISLLHMEEVVQDNDNQVNYLWTMSPETREAKKICICNLKVIGNVTGTDTKFKHMFFRMKEENTGNLDIPCNDYSMNEYLTVSTDTRINISSGFIVNITKNFVTVVLDRDITKQHQGPFHLNKHRSCNLFSLNLANVGGLLCDNEISEKLRNIVIDRKPATFQNVLSRSLVDTSARLMKNLNRNQKAAILKTLSTNDYVLIKGMPGTGKTQTVIALIELLHKTGHSILVTAYTNSAVDNILLKLLNKGLDFLRLGSSVRNELTDKAEGSATSHCNSPEALSLIYKNNIIGVTCYGAYHPVLEKRMFDVCIVDESTQALQCTVLRPLYSARKFVLLGDPDQLPPIIKCKEARRFGADESLFTRLDSENNTVILSQQYRMNKVIMRLANKLTYNDMMEVGNSSIADAILHPWCGEILKREPKWVQKTLSRDIDDSVIVFDSGCTKRLHVDPDKISKYIGSDEMNCNIWEAGIVKKLILILISMGVELQHIGVIAPYRAHVNLLNQIIPEAVEVNTVDQYQGRDKEVIIYSCVKSLSISAEIKEDLEILGDHRRLTVAITRAKKKLIIICDKHTMSRYAPFKKLFDFINDDNVIMWNDENFGFSWKNIMETLA